MKAPCKLAKMPEVMSFDFDAFHFSHVWFINGQICLNVKCCILKKISNHTWIWVLVAKNRQFVQPEQLMQVMWVFFFFRSGLLGLQTSRTSGYDHSATASPPAIARRPPITSGHEELIRFLSPCSKRTSGSHLTPVRPNFHFRGRCGFQIIYHFPKCFHMCAGFPSALGPCLRPTFSKRIKIQFAPKKFRHWCFIVVMSGNY